MRVLKRSLRIADDAFRRFIEDDGWAIASHIALSTLMALFPFLIVVAALAGFFFGSQQLADEAARLLLEAWPKQVAAPIALDITGVMTSTRGDVLTIGVMLALYFASSGVESLRIGLNRAYNIKEMRSWWVLRLELIVYVLVGAVAILAFSFLVVFAPLIISKLMHYVPALEQFGNTITLARYAVAASVLVMALTIVHLWLSGGPALFRPNRAGNHCHPVAVADQRRRFRPLSCRLRLCLRVDVCRSGIGHGRACFSVHLRVDFHLRRRAEFGRSPRCG